MVEAVKKKCRGGGGRIKRGFSEIPTETGNTEYVRRYKVAGKILFIV